MEVFTIFLTYNNSIWALLLYLYKKKKRTMKAAILKQYDHAPVYEEVETPQPNPEQELIDVKAAPLKNFDRLTTYSTFYARAKNLPTAVGSDGVGLTKDKKRVYAFGISGMFAEKALISKTKSVEIPEKLDWTIAAALPNAVMGAVLPMKIKGHIAKGSVVLINGATGFTGQLAVQAAKHYGAKTIIATGRNQKRLENLKTLGATHIISLKDSDWLSQIDTVQKDAAIDIVLDYIWGKPAEDILKTLSNGPTHSTRYIDLGNNAGNDITVSAGLIRNSAIEILGAGVGSYTASEFGQMFTEFIPEMYALAAEGKLVVNIQKAKLQDIEKIWKTPSESGVRTVFTID